MKYIYLTTLAACLSMFLTCTDNVTGNNNKDDINTVPAMLYNLDGSPAVHAKVRFFPVNYNPRSSNLSKKMAIVDSATTDSTGNYSVKLDPGKYNVLATGKSGVVYQSAITVSKDSTINPPVDTLKSPGGLSGRVKLQPGDDARTVFILFMGTNIWVTPDDSMGNFTALNMAQGTYKVRILTTLDQYVPKDTTLSITSGVIDTLQNNITLKYTGIPKPAGVIVSYDTLRQTVILEWSGVDTSIITGYNVYRAIKGQNLSLLTQTPLADTVTTFHDSTVSVGKTYQYEVVSYRSGQESQKAINPSDTMKALPSSLATTTFTCNLNEAIYDTAGIGDTIKICLTYSNPTRKVVKVFWYLDSLNSTAVRQKKDSSLTGKDTLSYSWKITGIKKIFVKAIDEAGTVWTDTYGISIIQDAPDITFISDDTTVNYGGAVRCSFYVKQKFGSMDVAIDTSNSGKFKNLGGFGLSGSKVYTFSTGNACTWDSVKVRVTDNRGNTVTKGFDVNIRLNSPTIKKINPDTTIGIGDSVTFNVSAVDSSGGITQIAWDFDGNGKYDWTSPTLQASGYRYQTTGLYKAVLRLTNECQKQTYDTVSMTVVQDVPIIRFLSDDTIVDHGGTVRCSVFVQQQFGTMTIEIDTSNNGSYKALGNLGLSGSKKYLFSTGNACTWDSVKVRVTDNRGNTVTKGFDVNIRLSSPTIKKINPDTTIGINDSVTFNVSAEDSSGGITQIAWDFDGNGKYDWTSPTLQASGYRYQTTGLYKAVLRLTNECQKQTYDTVSMAVVQDVPIIRFLSDDTIVDHGGSVRCSVFVQQQFGTMTIEIDTSNNGSYKALGNLGLSGSKKYLFSTGNACTWDSVKVRVTDNGMNVVTKGFRVRIRPRPLSITSIDSTVNTITIHYSKTKETDFSSYLIYRNTTSTVDTNSELWATITDNGITSYTLPAPSYALAPRYYRIYQRDNEGLWCVGSNVVYGNIVKSPPDKPVVIFPENNGDSIWPNDVLRWSCTPLTLNGLKISCKVFVNYNNTGYSQLATEPMDTSVRLTGCDTVQYLKFKITAFDSLGDSSSSSEKTAYIRHTVTDIDGNVYQTVTIGTQLWVVENLRTTKYNDGTAIPHVTDRAQWSSLSTPGYCWYDNSTVTTEHEKWGALYNWHAVNTGKLAPAGWHVPTDADWITIENYLIVDSFNNKNRTGFSVLPGYRDINGNFIQRGFEGYWWCVKEDGAPRTYIRYHNCLDADLSGPYGGGLSVRLLRD